MTHALNLTLLNPNQPDEAFPSPEKAWSEPNGLLAVGGDLSVIRLRNAYYHGVFPWFGDQEPIYWWTPDPRTVIFPENIRITRSLRKSMRNKGYRIAFDEDFRAVIQACSEPRAYASGTWITEEMQDAYCDLHAAGYAHCVGVYSSDNELIGGLYGVATGGIFSGESMFSRAPDTSKMALVALACHVQHWGFSVIDCQLENPHLTSMGAENISRDSFLRLLQQYRDVATRADWRVDQSIDLSRWMP